MSISVYEDNETCIHIATSGRIKKKSKYVDIKYCNMRQVVKDGLIEMTYQRQFS